MSNPLVLTLRCDAVNDRHVVGAAFTEDGDMDAPEQVYLWREAELESKYPFTRDQPEVEFKLTFGPNDQGFDLMSAMQWYRVTIEPMGAPESWR